METYKDFNDYLDNSAPTFLRKVPSKKQNNTEYIHEVTQEER